MLSPIGVFATSLLVSLALWWPTMLACLRGQLGLPAAGLRYLVAFALCRLALGGIARLIITYHLAAEAGAPNPKPQRRKEDQLA